MTNPPDASPETGISAPTCFRHPNRETYVSCVRCGRPACPDCLRSAAVGQQCVECVRQANSAARRPTGRFGGRVTSRPVVTWTLIGLNVLVYLAELVSQNAVINNGEMFGYGVAVGQWYRLITSAFLHYPPGSGFGLTHILFNMWALYVVGPALEQILGRGRFIAVYLVSALAGSVLFYLIAAPGAAAIGASGAIFGLFGSWFVLAKRLRMDSRQVVLLIVLNLVITFLVPGIAWQGHVGGLAAGAALTAAYVYAPRPSRTLVQVGATIGIVALLIVGVVVKDLQLVGTVSLF
ncbi:MAG TPA: rhomboid family intramembrane serine protease [Streptosporangiaceae bacterium]|nr:rhomboid family intramembrane serine protease [Streptosporangiaceae bacterium]